MDPTEAVDTDADGVGKNADRDDDGDGVEDALDAFPLNNYLSVLPSVDPAPVDPAAVDPASVELVAELTVAEALWRPFNRWIVEGNVTKADGTTDVGGCVIAELVKAAGTRIEIC